MRYSIFAAVIAAVFVGGCGSGSNKSTTQLTNTNNIGGCVAITQSLNFTGSNVIANGYQIIGGQMPSGGYPGTSGYGYGGVSQNSSSTLLPGGNGANQNGSYGSMYKQSTDGAISVALSNSTASGNSVNQLAQLDGTLTLSATAMSYAWAAYTTYIAPGTTNTTTVNNNSVQSQPCISALGINAVYDPGIRTPFPSVAPIMLSSIVFVYLNNTQHGFWLAF